MKTSSYTLKRWPRLTHSLLAWLALAACLFLPAVSRANLIHSSDMELHGQYTYRFLGLFDIVEISLYRPSSIEAVNATPTDHALSLRFEYGRSFTREQLIAQGDKALQAEFSAEEIAQHAATLQKLNEAYRDVEKGDAYRLDYQPDQGLSLALNGQPLVTIDDPAFARFYLKIWLGQREECEPIRRQLLS